MEGARDGGPVDLVLEGGGVKGVGLVGALAILAERGYTFQNVAGTSAGAITASLIAAGYSPPELLEILLDLDFTKFEDETWEKKIPVLGDPLSVFLEEGLYKGEAFLQWITGLLEQKGIRTFADLIAPDSADEPDSRFRLMVIASDITGHRLLRLPQDAERLGADPDELSVAEAVRMSMSIPIFFEPWHWVSKAKGEDFGQDHLIVDGGLLSNFPVWIFDSNGEPRWPTFGLMLVESAQRTPVAARLGEPRSDTDIVTYAKDLVKTVLEAHDRLYLENDTFVRTITIDTLGVATTDFNLSRDRKVALYESGRAAAVDFLDHRWDFADYKNAFRRQEPPRRSEVLKAAQHDRR
jgi:NTE family protein